MQKGFSSRRNEAVISASLGKNCGGGTGFLFIVLFVVAASDGDALVFIWLRCTNVQSASSSRTTASSLRSEKTIGGDLTPVCAFGNVWTRRSADCRILPRLWPVEYSGEGPSWNARKGLFVRGRHWDSPVVWLDDKDSFLDELLAFTSGEAVDLDATERGLDGLDNRDIMCNRSREVSYK